MNRDDIIRMAREAGFESHDISLNFPKELERFFNAAYAAGAEAEREQFAVHAVDIARRAVAEERKACAYRAGIALLGADRGLTNRVNRAILSRGEGGDLSTLGGNNV